ncbi:Hypp4964 [Branchiostoma lanceolatum]|uniref:Hypp4964 protein n=1 Tax=Branchiostoma lanceolatum TaxID=7740 RepID=A0A8K0EXS3_BRALA|nr:Hypp4964 [Branchiostoma lanceolatum]
MLIAAVLTASARSDAHSCSSDSSCKDSCSCFLQYQLGLPGELLTNCSTYSRCQGWCAVKITAVLYHWKHCCIRSLG